MGKKRLSTFIAGMLAGAMLLGCGTAALAAADGGVRFGAMGLEINNKTVIKAGDTVTNANGNEIPSTIVYTDEQGGDTTYLPIRTISELLDIPVFYEDNTVYLGSEPTSEIGTITIGGSGGVDTITTIGGSGDGGGSLWETRPLHQAGAKAGALTEVEPVWPANDKITSYSVKDETTSTSYSISGECRPFPNEGGYCSIKLTNNTDSDLVLTVSCVSTITRDSFPSTVVPAGETVTRTFHADAYTGGLSQPGLAFALRRDLSRPGNVKDPVSALVNICTFDPERTGPALFG